MKDQVISPVFEQLESQVNTLRAYFLDSSNGVGVRYYMLDSLLPDDIVHRIFKAFLNSSLMSYLSSFCESRYISKGFDFAGLLTLSNCACRW